MKKLLKPKKDKATKTKEKKKKEEVPKGTKETDNSQENTNHQRSFGHPAALYDPNWLMPPQSNVIHVEHSMEAPSDPRPNAFFDNRNGVMRVYHGSSFGNPT
ncbi:hypothetical protein Micbo1qcDRAFT_159429, partial [Microdochium bolleyi]